MLIMEYQSIRGDNLTDYAEHKTCNLLHAYIYAHFQILIYEQNTGNKPGSMGGPHTV